MEGYNEAALLASFGSRRGKKEEPSMDDVYKQMEEDDRLRAEKARSNDAKWQDAIDQFRQMRESMWPGAQPTEATFITPEGKVVGGGPVAALSTPMSDSEYNDMNERKSLMHEQTPEGEKFRMAEQLAKMQSDLPTKIAVQEKKLADLAASTPEAQMEKNRLRYELTDPERRSKLPSWWNRDRLDAYNSLIANNVGEDEAIKMVNEAQ